MKHKLVPIILIIIILTLGVFYWQNKNKNEVQAPVAAAPLTAKENFTCVGEKETDFACYKAYYANIVANESTQIAFADLKKRYEENTFVSSQCHPLVHVIGYESSKKFTDVGEAYKDGDNFCSSGYYHGVLEGMVTKVGYENLTAKLNDICASVANERRYSLMHHNCTHGLGHGLMAITDSDLFKSLELCDILNDSWERASCHGGVFMENIIFDSKYHASKYLKPSDPLYPCDAVKSQYRDPCYLIQTAYMLQVTGSDWQKVFELCSTVGPNSATCYQSLGRDASGYNLADPQSIKNICMLGKNFAEQSNCIIGAAKDVVWYRYGVKEAENLCALLEQDLQPICYSTVSTYYQTL